MDPDRPVPAVWALATLAACPLVLPVPPWLVDSVPVMPVASGRPVALVRIAALGVPRFGVASMGLDDSTTAPEPVELVTPVPPLVTGKVPCTCVESMIRLCPSAGAAPIWAPIRASRQVNRGKMRFIGSLVQVWR